MLTSEECFSSSQGTPPVRRTHWEIRPHLIRSSNGKLGGACFLPERGEDEELNSWTTTN